jgi:hypothetical protein
MADHLTDIACLEWVRHRRIKVAPNPPGGAESHLATCPECQRKMVDFEALERSFLAYGTPMRPPRALAVGEALKVAGLVVVIAGVAVILARVF